MIKKKIAFIVTSSISVNAFLVNHIKILNKDFHVDIITNDIEKINLTSEYKKIELRFYRKINIIGDIVSLFKLIKLIKKK